MEATITNISYRYRAPIRYIIFTAGFLLAGGVGAFFFAVVTPWIFRAVTIFIMAVGFLGGLAFLIYWLKSLGGHVVFSQDTVMLPYRHKRQPVMLEYSALSLTEEMHTYGRRLVVSDADGREYCLDETWMPRGRFDEMLEMFREKTES